MPADASDASWHGVLPIVGYFALSIQGVGQVDIKNYWSTSLESGGHERGGLIFRVFRAFSHRNRSARRCFIARKKAAVTKEPQSPSALPFAIEAARLCANTRCHSVSVLDVREISPVCDYLVLASGTSKRQMQTVSEDLEEMGTELKNSAYQVSGRESDQWILVDFVDVVVHIFNDESRRFYDLDNLWGDAPKVEWEK